MKLSCLFALVLALASLGCPSPLSAQVRLGYYGGARYAPRVRAYGYRGYSGYGGGLGGIYSGQARLVQSWGQYNRDVAAAGKVWAEARQIQAQTQAQQVRNYWDARRTREEFMHARHAQRRGHSQP
ncbi:MAG: hypothetical protein U0836_24580 [Pirellulales bacterium]